MSNNEESEEDIGLILVDAPVGPFSPKNEILDWIKKLNNHPYKDRPEIQEELKAAKAYLKLKDIE